MLFTAIAFKRAAALTAAAALLGACAALPSSGPTGGRITESGTTSQYRYRIVEITPESMSAIPRTAPARLSALSDKAVGPSGARISEGDVLSVNIFSIGANPMGNAAAANADQNPTTRDVLPNLFVSNGAVSVPFAGRVPVTGLTVEEVQNRIAGALKTQSVQPQVLVNIAARMKNAVLVYGDVKATGRFPLPLTPLTILDAIALAGGPLHAAEDISVIINRSDVSATCGLADIHAVAQNNVELTAGDRIELQYRPRSFAVFGASPRVLDIKFEQPQLTLGEAIARAGGPDQQFADPSSVYLFRFETPAAESRIGLMSPGNAVIYHLDLMKGDSYFALQEFAMRDGDIIYIGNARSNTLQKFLALLGQAFSPTATGMTLAR